MEVENDLDGGAGVYASAYLNCAVAVAFGRVVAVCRADDDRAVHKHLQPLVRAFGLRYVQRRVGRRVRVIGAALAQREYAGFRLPGRQCPLRIGCLLIQNVRICRSRPCRYAGSHVRAGGWRRRGRWGSGRGGGGVAVHELDGGSLGNRAVDVQVIPIHGICAGAQFDAVHIRLRGLVGVHSHAAHGRAVAGRGEVGVRLDSGDVSRNEGERFPRREVSGDA